MQRTRVFTHLITVICSILLLSLPVSPAQASPPDQVHSIELTFNPSGPNLNNGKFNPFAIKEIREAMNILIDRDYIKDNLRSMVPQWTPISSFEEDYPALQSDIAAIEAQYAHNQEDAVATIAHYMEVNGAVEVGGHWQYDGEAITLIILIRLEDERHEIGDYVAGLLEDIGFTVDRQYKYSSEAFPIWYSSDPADGGWHIYTGGWRGVHEGGYWAGVFQFHYTPDSKIVDAYGESPLYAAYAPSVDFWALANEIAEDDFPSNEDRLAAVSEALGLAMEDSVRVWIGEYPTYTMYQPIIMKP